MTEDIQLSEVEDGDLEEAVRELHGALVQVAGGLHRFEQLDPDYMPKRAAWCEEQARRAMERYRDLVMATYSAPSPKASTP